MSTTVHPIRSTDVDPAWLTGERLTAYLVAMKIDPEIVLAPVLARTALVERIAEGLRAALYTDAPANNRIKAMCIDLMRQDAEDAAGRRQIGGW